MYASTPEEALTLCQELVDVSLAQLREEELQRSARGGRVSDDTGPVTVIDELRRDIVEWYVRLYDNINYRVGHVLESFS